MLEKIAGVWATLCAVAKRRHGRNARLRLTGFGGRPFEIMHSEDDKVWARLDATSQDDWQPATVLSRDVGARQPDAAESNVEIVTDGGERAVLPAGRVTPRNAEDQDRVPDLAQLVHLSEPCLLHALAERYADGDIYTYTGSIMIALNPWKPVEQLYTPEQLAAYRSQPLGSLPPHLFALADAAYRGLVQDGDDQTILVSGESGAGKTESTRRLLEFLVFVSSRAAGRPAGGLGQTRRPLPSTPAAPTKTADQLMASGAMLGPSRFDTSTLLSPEASKQKSVLPLTHHPGLLPANSTGGLVQRRLLQANPLLETFGNAQTTRNDNSSRFGKFVQLYLDGGGAITGGCVRTYLLEKSRVVAQGAGERNYHIFYQLLKGADRAQKDALMLLPSSQYAYLQHGSSPTTAANASGHAGGGRLAETLDAMGCVGISPTHRGQLLRILSALMHLGNVNVSGRRDVPEGCVVSEGSATQALSRACKLMRTAPAALGAALCERRIDAGGESFRMPLTPTAAAHARDAVAKAIFSRVFNHLVRCINKALSLPATASLPPSPRRSGRTTPKFAEEEDLAVQELEAKEAEAEAAAVAEAEAEAEEEEKEANRKERESGAGSDYWSDAPLDVPPSPMYAPLATKKGKKGKGAQTPAATWGRAAGHNPFAPPSAAMAATTTNAMTPGGPSAAANGGGGSNCVGRICCLDIFGFETFEVNGYEQLCINFTNEKLQQLFIDIVFKEQQAEYAEQGIPWVHVSYDDNAQALTLLEGPQGVLAMLEEQCMLGERASDGGFCRSLTTGFCPNGRKQITSNRARIVVSKTSAAAITVLPEPPIPWIATTARPSG